MSGTLPVDPGLNGLTVNSNFSVIRNTSISGVQTTTRLPGHFWSFTLNYPNLDRTELGSIYAFLNSQEGFDTFQFTPTKYLDTAGSASSLATTHSGTISTTLTVDATYATGVKSSIGFTSAFTSSYYTFASNGYFFKAGDFIKFSNHNKVYQITNNVILNGSGSGSIDIAPRLQEGITNSTTITYSSVPFTVVTTDNVVTFEGGLGDTHGISIELREKP